MARYDFRCRHGHVTEAVFAMAEVPSAIECPVLTVASDAATALRVPGQIPVKRCDELAERIFEAPAAIHFKGPGFYATDVKGRLERKRRKNVADDLPRGDGDTHALARRW